MIFKVQKPLATNLPHPEVLIYNKSRTVEETVPMGKTELYEFFGNTVKQYWKGRVKRTKGTNNIILEERVEDQDW